MYCCQSYRWHKCVLPLWCQTYSLIWSVVPAYSLTCKCHLRGLPDQTSCQRWAGSSCHWLPPVSRPTQYSWDKCAGSLGSGPFPLQTLLRSSLDGNLALLKHKAVCSVRLVWVKSFRHGGSHTHHFTDKGLVWRRHQTHDLRHKQTCQVPWKRITMQYEILTECSV